jgi:hypothetical protein
VTTHTGAPAPGPAPGDGVTAAAIARQLGIDGTAVTGAEFGAMSDEQALSKIGEIGAIARPPAWMSGNG